MTARSMTFVPSIDTARASTGRIGELDAIRGIAALIVVFHHCWQTLLPDQNTFPFVTNGLPITADERWVALVNLSPLRLLFAGHPAVGVFFVLSGLVLTRQLQGAHQLHYAQFLIRRIFRIWVPFAIVILAAALACQRLGGPLPQLPWVDESWNHPVTWQLLAGHLLMLGTSAYVSLDNPMWSLIHEVRIALIFPLLVRTARHAWLGLLIAAAVLFTLLSIAHLTGPVIRSMPGELAGELLRSFIDTARYGFFFILGIGLALKGPEVGAWLRGRSRRRTLLWIAALALLSVPYLAACVELAYAVGATLLLALCMHSQRARQVLRAPALAWLGKISYSLYLVHLVVLLSLVHALHARLPVYAILPLVVAASLVIADLTNRVLELPANRVGKHLASHPAFPGSRTLGKANEPDQA